jgi:hypothetical protein
MNATAHTPHTVQPFPSSAAPNPGAAQAEPQRRKGTITRSQLKRVAAQRGQTSPISELPASHEVLSPATQTSSEQTVTLVAAPKSHGVAETTFNSLLELAYYCVPLGEHNAVTVRGAQAVTPKLEKDSAKRHLDRCGSYLSLLFRRGHISRKLNRGVAGSGRFLYWREDKPHVPKFGHQLGLSDDLVPALPSGKSPEPSVKRGPPLRTSPTRRLRTSPALSKHRGPAEVAKQVIQDRSLVQKVMSDRWAVDHQNGVSSIHYPAEIQVGERLMTLTEAASLHESLGEALKSALQR